MPWQPLTDDQWKKIEPLLPHAQAKRGRKLADDRLALDGILCVHERRLAWQDIKAAQFGCSGTTCRRRMNDWRKAGLWPQLRQALRESLSQR